MKQMRHHLRRLPKEDYDRAIEYFEEYFEEAGPDHEQQAIEDLGSPEIAADQIIRDLAMRKRREAKCQCQTRYVCSLGWNSGCIRSTDRTSSGIGRGAVLPAIVLVVLSVIFAIFITAVALAASAVPL